MIVLFLFLIAPVAGLSQTAREEAGGSTIAKVGTKFISEREFQERFELTPAFGKRSATQLDEEKLEFAYSLVAEKLLAQQAVEQGIEREAPVRGAIENIRRLLARDELFRREVSSTVRVSQAEIADGMKKALRELVLKYLYFPDRQDAEFVRRQIRTLRDFDRLRIDTSMSFLRDTVTLSWGNADEEIEKAAYALKKGVVSPVVPAGSGFYILAIDAEHTSRFYGGMQPGVFHERIEEKLRSRKEKARMEEFVHQLMARDTAYGRPAPLEALSAALREIVTRSVTDTSVALTPAIATELRSRSWPIPMDSLVVIGAEVWSLDAVLDKLGGAGFDFGLKSAEEIFDTMNFQLKVWTQQELLAQEGLRRKLDAEPEVRDRLEMWKEHITAEALKNRVQAEATVKPAETWSFMASQDATLKIPRVQIRVLRTDSLTTMQKAMNDLVAGTSFASVVRRWSQDSAAKVSGGLTDLFSVTNEPFGPLAWEMNVGERQGPLRLADGIYLFELVRKERPPSMSDTSFVSRYRKAASDLAELKRKGHVDNYLARLGSRLGFAVYEDRVKQMHLSPIPMVTYRLLGFGGRMFEVPFVDKQTDWLAIEAGKAQTVQ